MTTENDFKAMGSGETTSNMLTSSELTKEMELDLWWEDVKEWVKKVKDLAEAGCTPNTGRSRNTGYDDLPLPPHRKQGEIKRRHLIWPSDIINPGDGLEEVCHQKTFPGHDICTSNDPHTINIGS